MTPEEQYRITELIKRYEGQLRLPFIQTPYYPDEETWRKAVESKITELKQKFPAPFTMQGKFLKSRVN